MPKYTENQTKAILHGGMMCWYPLLRAPGKPLS